MKLNKLYLTNNNCYKAGVKFTPKGIMVHSTAVNNPKLSRYVGPDDGKLGVNRYNNHWNTPLPGGKEVCVHAFIGKLADGTIATYQTLPWDMRGWHAGDDEGNNDYIGFEICEANLHDKDYFNKVYKEATELCAYLCKMHNFNPLKDGVIICHSEGHSRGIASNHSDVMHWFPLHGKSMDTFRKDVASLLIPKKEDVSESKDNSEFKIGDKVMFKGNIHYVSPIATSGKSIKSGEAKIIDISKGSKHPYHVRAIDEQGKFVYGVYGWVDAHTISKVTTSFVPHLVKVTANSLNIRKGPGVSYKVNGVISDKGVYTIIAEKNGWGLLKSEKGWINLNYTKKF